MRSERRRPVAVFSVRQVDCRRQASSSSLPIPLLTHRSAAADDKEVLVKINLASPPRRHLRHPAERGRVYVGGGLEKKTRWLVRLAAANISNVIGAGRGEKPSFIHGRPLVS